MRIIAGTFRNRPLITPKGPHTRPTTARTRACVFNILQDRITNSRFLDICAGSGAMGIEAMSRGAQSVTFIENERHAQEAIRKNIAQFDLHRHATLLPQSASVALQALAKRGHAFDIIYFDPPYGSATFTTTILQLIDTLSLLSPGGTLFVEERDSTSLEMTTLMLKSKRTLGQTVLWEFVQYT